MAALAVAVPAHGPSKPVGIQLRYAVAFHDFPPNQRFASVPVIGTCAANVKSFKLLNFRDVESFKGLSVLFLPISFR